MIAGAGERAAPPSRRPRRPPGARLSRMVPVACARLCRSWVSRERRPGGDREAGIPTKVPLIATAPLGRRQDLGEVHRAHAGALSRQQAADVHQAGVVAGDQHLGAGVADVARLVRTHGDRGVGVLHREGAAEAAALLGPRALIREVAHRIKHKRFCE